MLAKRFCRGHLGHLGTRMRAISSFFILALAAAPALAQEQQPPDEYRGTAEQRAACTGDVFRLCAWHIPNVDNIVGCLKEKKASLSPACRVVFDTDRPPQRTAQPRRITPPQTEGAGGTWRW
jgi:hypothetical protein